MAPTNPAKGSLHAQRDPIRLRRNILIGVIAAVLHALLQYAPPSSLIPSSQDLAMEIMMIGSASQSTLDLGSTSRALPLTFIDIDERTWRNAKWGGGEPTYSPRPALLELVKFAIRANPRYVVLDVLIEGKVDDPEEQAFASALAGLVSTTFNGPKVIVVRSVRFSLGDPNIHTETSAVLPELHPSALDEIIGTANGQITSAAPYFFESEDGVVRDWELWRAVCHSTGADHTLRAAVLPSVQLVIAAAERGVITVPWQASNDDKRCSDAAIVDLGERALLDQRVANWFHKMMDPSISPSDLVTETNGSIANRIFYRIGDFLNARDAALKHSSLLRMTRISALDILESADDTLGHVGSAIAGGVVVIGVSHGSSGDILRTPLGEMPGAIVVLNSIDSLLRFGVLRRPSAAWILLFSIPIILVVAWANSRWQSLAAHLFITALALILILPVSYACLQFGLWLDFLWPVVIMQFYGLVENVISMFSRRTDSNIPSSSLKHGSRASPPVPAHGKRKGHRKKPTKRGHSR